MQVLHQFYMNKVENEAVQAFMIECLSKIAVEKTFSGEDVSGIKDARELIDRMFDELEVLYGKEEKKVVYNTK